MSRPNNQEQAQPDYASQHAQRRNVHDAYPHTQQQQEWLPNLSHALYNNFDGRQNMQPKGEHQYHPFSQQHNSHGMHSLPPMHQQQTYSYSVQNQKQMAVDGGFSHPKPLSYAVNNNAFAPTVPPMSSPNSAMDKQNYTTERFAEIPKTQAPHTPIPKQEDWYVQVKIVNGRYDRVGECWLDEGQKKIHLLVETNIPRHLIKLCTVYCEKETNNKRTKVFAVPNSSGSTSDEESTTPTENRRKLTDMAPGKHFEYYKGSWKYTYRCQSGFPVKSGITHSPLRFIAEVLISREGEEDRIMSFISDEQFYMYSKIPENVKLKKQQQQQPAGSRRNSDEDLTPKDTPPTPSFRSTEEQSQTSTAYSTPSTHVSPPVDFMTALSQQQERLESVEKTLLSMPRTDNQMLQRLYDSIQQIGSRQETQFQQQMRSIKELQAGQDDLRRHLRGTTITNLFSSSLDMDKYVLSKFDFTAPAIEPQTKKRKVDSPTLPTEIDIQVVRLDNGNRSVLREESFPSGIVEAKQGDIVSLQLSHTSSEPLLYFVLYCDLIYSRIETLSAETSRFVEVEDKMVDCGTKSLVLIEPNATIVHQIPLHIEDRFISKDQDRGMIRFKVFAIPTSRYSSFIDNGSRDSEEWTIANRVMLVNGIK